MAADDPKDEITRLRSRVRELEHRLAEMESAESPPTMEIRRYFRKLVELEFPHLAVLSYQELSPDMNIQPIARISLE